MNRRALLAAAGTAAVAGCLDRTTTDEPVGDSADETPTPDPSEETPDESVSNPPGIDDDGVHDRDALLAAHEDAVTDRAFTLDSTARTIVDGDDGAVEERSTYLLKTDGTDVLLVEASEGPDGEYDLETYVDGERSLRYRRHSEGDRSAEWLDNDGRYGPHSIASQMLRDVVEIFEFGAPEPARHGETPAVRLPAVGPTEETEDMLDEDELDDATVEFLADETGLVRSVTATDVPLDWDEDAHATLDIEMEIRNLGATEVAEPEWIDGVDIPPHPSEIETYDGWLDGVDGYYEPKERTGTDEIEIVVGADDGLRFDPAAAIVDAGTTVRWTWSGGGGAHNVAHEDGAFESELTDAEGFTFEHTFEEPGVYRYSCLPHEAVGMRGVIEVV